MKNGLIIALASIVVILIAFVAVFVYNRKYLIMDGPGMVNTAKHNSISKEDGGIIDGTGDIEKSADNKGEIDKPENEEAGNMNPVAIVQVVVGDTFFTINLEDNSSAEEFLDKLKKDNLTVKMSDFGGFEKVGDLPWPLTTNDTEITTEPGDLILYQGDKITIYYGENTWNFTKLGRLNAEPEEIVAAFGGEGDVTAEFSVEWTE